MALTLKSREDARVKNTPGVTSDPEVKQPTVPGPRSDLLRDKSLPRGATVTLGVAFRASSPVTVIWRVDLTVIWRQDAGVCHGWTRLTIRSFDYRHHRRRYSVEIVDRQGRRVWTAGTLKIRH